MSYIDSTTATIVATLTRRGRELLATDSSKLNIVKFAFDDAEINYADFDGSNPDAPNTTVLSTPILQPSTNSNAALRWGVVTLPRNTTVIAKLVPSLSQVGTVMGQTVQIGIRTLYGFDSGYYVSTNSNNILLEKDFYEGIADNNLFDTFQRQSMCTINFTTVRTNNFEKSNLIFVTVKGKDTGASFNIRVGIRDTQGGIRDARNDIETVIEPGFNTRFAASIDTEALTISKSTPSISTGQIDQATTENTSTSNTNTGGAQ